MAKKKSDDGRFCTFCGKGRAEVQNMISGPSEICICEECVEVCNQILRVEKKSYKTPKTPQSPYHVKKLPTPVEIRDQLDNYVIGQDRTASCLICRRSWGIEPSSSIFAFNSCGQTPWCAASFWRRSSTWSSVTKIRSVSAM